MKIHSFSLFLSTKFLSFTLCFLLLGNQAMAASFQMDFWSLAQTQNFVNTTIAGQSVMNVRKITEAPLATGTFSIADSALGVPNAFISFNSSDFQSFTATIAGSTFDLPGDLLSTAAEPLERQLGVRLDKNGDVQRFDIPLFFVSNSGYIYDDESSAFPNPSLTLWDKDPFGSESYFVQDAGGWVLLPAGTASTLGLVNTPFNMPTVILPAGDSILSGYVQEWRSTGLFDGPTNGVLRISQVVGTPGPDQGPSPAPVPEPSTFILLGTGIAGLIAWRRRIS